jgi:hypothetical protein
MSQRLKLGTKSEIENVCVMFWCLTPNRGKMGKGMPDRTSYLNQAHISER